ncbi:hypothetical protein NDU88_006424 [Pleurodeles waltl]|uniref:Uncharacterized protein n=1 Tax=Pleurodeles waltl TaxID=8319 RepID=A0AAV7LSJ1_PLEWA|nr:hypothetical protein NDU88_006424 [Pleurodeles waltl]
MAKENKIEMVALKVNVLHTDLRKVSEKVWLAEGSTADLQTEVAALKKQVAVVSSWSGALEARMEDEEGRSHCNNVRLLVFPEQAKGVNTEQFEES